MSPGVSCNLKFLNDLKSAAPNLLVFRNLISRPDTKYLAAKSLITGQNFNKGKYDEFSFAPIKQDIDLLEKLVKLRPKFKSISINLKSIKNQLDGGDPIQLKTGVSKCQVDLRARVSVVLTKLLAASRLTLEKLENIEQLELLPNLQIPVLTRVKTLKIRVVNEFADDFKFDNFAKCFFPIKNLNFPVTLPNLENLELEGPSKNSMAKVCASTNDLPTFDLWFDRLQLNWTPTNTVTSIKIYSGFSYFPPALVRQLGKIFPTTENLELVDLENFAELVPEIWWNFPKLVNFSATIFIRTTYDIVLIRQAFGIPQIEVETHIKKAFVMGRETEIAEHPGIYDLSGLRRVHLDLRSFDPKMKQLLFESDCLEKLKKQLAHVLPTNAGVTIFPRDGSSSTRGRTQSLDWHAQTVLDQIRGFFCLKTGQ